MYFINFFPFNLLFFNYSVVKGNLPKAGDNVFVEATYNPNMPFKWNASRVQVLPNQVVQVIYIF